MSAALHAPLRAAEHEPHRRLAIGAAVVSTLAVIVGPLLVAAIGLHGRFAPPDGRHDPLTPNAERVLLEVPGAYRTGDLVVVPAGTDPDVLWSQTMTTGRVEGPRVGLGVHGLAAYGYLPSLGQAPAWLRDLGPQDRVFTDVGPLWFACTEWPGADGCTGTLLIRHGRDTFIFRSGLSLAKTPGQVVFTFAALDTGLPTELVLGGAPSRAAAVIVTVGGSAGDRVIRARTARYGAGGRSTLWWASVTGPVTAVTLLDARGLVLRRASVGD